MINPHLRKASKFMEAGELCLNNQYFDSCASRSYYALYRAAVAALEHEGYIRPSWSHGALLTSFSNRLVKEKDIYKPELVKHLEWNYQQRIIADYKGDSVDESDARRSLKNAEAFVKKVKEVIGYGKGEDG